MAADSAVFGPTRPQSEVIKAFIVVLLTCKHEEDPIKNEGGRVVTTLCIDFSDAQWQITTDSVVVSGRNLNSSRLGWFINLFQ